MLQASVNNLHEHGVSPIIIVAGYHSEQIRAQMDGYPVEIVINPQYEKTEMIHSLILGYKALHSRCEYVLIQPGDRPIYSPAALISLLSSEGRILKPVYRGVSGHPIRIETALLGQLLSYPSATSLKERISILAQPAHVVLAEDEGILMNQSSIGEYRKLLHYNACSGGPFSDLHLHCRVSFRVKDIVIDEALIQLLEIIGVTRSLHQACTDLHISYTKAWRLLRSVEDRLGFALINRKVGGSCGGSSSLTIKAEKLIEQYRRINDELQAKSTEVSVTYRSQITQLFSPDDL